MIANSAYFALLLSLLAGLSTGIGGLIAFFGRHTSTKFLSTAMGFSAGVMIYISLTELLPDAKRLLGSELGLTYGNWATVAAFFAGISVTALIDRMVPAMENVHEPKKLEEMGRCPVNKKLLRVGLFTAIAITIHNFPEGLATFFAALHDTKIGVATAFAVGMHNIPEGIAVSVPIYCATQSRRKAFFYSFLSGLAEPLGAVLGYLFLRPYLNDAFFGVIFAAVAGIMVFISFDELLPSAHEYGEHHLAVYGLIAGMITIAASLALFGV